VRSLSGFTVPNTKQDSQPTCSAAEPSCPLPGQGSACLSHECGAIEGRGWQSEWFPARSHCADAVPTPRQLCSPAVPGSRRSWKAQRGGNRVRLETEQLHFPQLPGEGTHGRAGRLAHCHPLEADSLQTLFSTPPTFALMHPNWTKVDAFHISRPQEHLVGVFECGHRVGCVHRSSHTRHPVFSCSK
jgi:hypothetical protein